MHAPANHNAWQSRRGGEFGSGRKSGGTQVNTNDVVISSNDDGRGKNDASREKDRKEARMEKRT